MKIRSGFVSNSSSSSFIVTGESSMTIALAMMSKVYEEWKPHKQLAAAIKYAKAHRKFDGNIHFPWSCNYETWIRKSGRGDYEIHTCNNHNWDELNIVGSLEDCEDTGFNRCDYFDLRDKKTKSYDTIIRWRKRNDNN